MKNRLLCLSILLITLSACKDQKESTALAEASETEKVDSLAIQYHELGRFSGSILVAKNDSVIFHKNYGLADYDAEKEFLENTAFKVGSMTEFFTEAIFVEMLDNEQIEVNEKVSFYLPEIQKDFTIRELLTHTSGLPDIKTVKELNPETEYSPVEFANIADIDPEKPAFRSDLGYNILGLVLEKVNKESFQETLEKYSAAWNLENTYFNDPAATNEAKGYLFGNVSGEGLELQEASTYNLEEAFSSNGIKSGIYDVLKLTQLTKRNTIEQNDYLQNDGFSYSLSKDEQAGLTVIVLSNRRHPIAHEISNSIRAIYKDQPYEIPLPKTPVAVNTSSYTEYAGSYSLNPKMNLNIIASNDSLFLMMGPEKIHLIPQSETQFFMEESDASIKFIPNPNQSVSRAILYDGFLTGTEIFKVSG